MRFAEGYVTFGKSVVLGIDARGVIYDCYGEGL